MNKNRVFVLTNVPVPYRIDFFNELGKYCELRVVFEQSVKEQEHRSSKWFDRKPINFESIFLFEKGDKKNNCKIIPFLKENKDSVIIIMGYSLPTEIVAIFWLKIHHIPFILSCDGGFAKYGKDKKKYIKKFLITSASRCLSTGEATDEFLMYYGAKKENLLRIPFTTLYQREIFTEPISEEQRQDIKRKIGLNEKKIIISVGQFIYRKGYDILLHACEGLDKEIGVYIIGSEPTEEYIKMKKNLRLQNVHFLGFKNKEELREYYLAADLFALSTREDIWGLVINEALACGLPVITTNRCIAGLELVDGSNGCIVPVDDYVLLREEIDSILSDSERLRNMRKESIRKIQEYSIENMARVHASIISDFSKRKR